MPTRKQTAGTNAGANGGKKARARKADTAPPGAPSEPPGEPHVGPADPGATTPAPPGMPVVYHEVKIAEYSTTSPLGPITPDDMKGVLGWQTESDYVAQMLRENPGTKPEHWAFGESGPRRKDNGEFQPIHCINVAKEKVVCWNNAGNRPFDMLWCEDLIHTILYGHWAGPLMLPGETINGETVRVSRYGRVLSGQHQGTALILADEFLQKSRAEEGNAANPKYPAWNGHEHCVIETIMVTGLSEDERVLSSIDYVKPRTLADVFYTRQIFRGLAASDRRDMTRMLSAATDVLWERTDTKGYKTHQEQCAFLDRHKRLLACVEHIFAENGFVDGATRRLSKLRLSPGHCAALLYLMGSGSQKTQAYSDEYRNESPPSEKGLDWSCWDRAREFWSRLAGDRAWTPVREALGRLLDSSPGDDKNVGLGGRTPEKWAILAKAWERWRDHRGAGSPFSDDDLRRGGCLELRYTDLDARGAPLPDGQKALIDCADFGGIDCPESLGRSHKGARTDPPMAPAPTPEEIEKAREEAHLRRNRKS